MLSSKDPLFEFGLCSKMISPASELTLPAGLFCQPIDIGLDLQAEQTYTQNNMRHYPTRSEQNAIRYISSLLSCGVRTVMIRMDAPSEYKGRSILLDRQAGILHAIRKQFSRKSLTIIVDPFSIALNPDRTWGVQLHGKLDYKKTAELFAELTHTFGQAGADYILTLGRFEQEVAVTRQALQKHRLTGVQIASFSTNTETANAYVYGNHDTYQTTGQKILVSNTNEMIFRSLVDMYEGTNAVIIKPAENLHVIERLKTMLMHSQLLEEFLVDCFDANLLTSAYLQHIHRSIANDMQSFVTQNKQATLGAYTVSGTYFNDMQMLGHKGGSFLDGLLYERFCNIAAALKGWPGRQLIIDRNVHWFIARRQRQS
jgi:delta-aminolevulinic acid dehydratase/porphobilinogen synthase